MSKESCPYPVPAKPILIESSHLRPYNSSYLLPSVFTANALLFSPVRAICLADIFLGDFSVPTIFYKE
jgi:hypothetical protein